MSVTDVTPPAVEATGREAAKIIDGLLGEFESEFASSAGPLGSVTWSIYYHDAPRTVNEVALYMAPTTFGLPPTDENEDSANPKLPVNFSIALHAADGTFIAAAAVQGNTKRVRRVTFGGPIENVSAVTFYLKHNNGAPGNATLMAEMVVS